MSYTESAAISTLSSAPSESYIIGAALNDESVVDEFSHILSAGVFANPQLGQVWQALCELAASGKPVDLATLAVSASEVVSNIGVQRLVTIQQSYLGRREAQWHVDKLLEINARRRLLEGLSELQEQTLNVSDVGVEELRASLEQVASSLETVKSGIGLHDGWDEAQTWVEGVETRFKDPSVVYGMNTGWSDLDAKTLGWQRTDLIVVGGRTSVGKTAFAIENLIRITARGYKTAMFSLEMSKEQVRNRVSGNMAEVSLAKIRTGRMSREEFNAVIEARRMIEHIAIDDTRGASADYIIAEMRRWKRNRGLDFVVVDYLQELFEPSLKNDNNGGPLARAARKLRKAAADCDCAVMVLSQLTREADGEPKISHLFGSSGIESAADLVILLHRDKEKTPKILDVNLAKQRNGPTGKIQLYYDIAKQRISNHTSGRSEP